MSDSLNKYCSEAKDLKDVKDAMNKIQKLRAQMKNPTVALQKNKKQIENRTEK